MLIPAPYVYFFIRHWSPVDFREEQSFLYPAISVIVLFFRELLKELRDMALAIKACEEESPRRILL